MSRYTLNQSTDRESEVWIVDAARTPLARPGAALLEVQPAALLAGLLRDIRARAPDAGDALPWAPDALVVGSHANGGSEPETLAAALARAGSPAQVTACGLRGSGVEAVRIAAEQVRSGDLQLAIAGGIHMLSHSRRGAPAAMPDILGAVALPAVAPCVAADTIATLAGVTSQEVAARVHAWRSEGPPTGVQQGCVPVRDLNGLSILATDELQLEAQRATPEAEERLRNHEVVARQVHPRLDHIDRVHGPSVDAPEAEGACLLLLGRSETARRLGMRACARIVASASAGHVPLHALDSAMHALGRAMERAGWRSKEVDQWEICSRFAGVPLAIARARGIDAARVNPASASWWHGHAGAASSAIALARLVGALENSGARRGGLLCMDDTGACVALLIERGHDD